MNGYGDAGASSKHRQVIMIISASGRRIYHLFGAASRDISSLADRRLIKPWAGGCMQTSTCLPSWAGPGYHCISILLSLMMLCA